MNLGLRGKVSSEFIKLEINIQIIFKEMRIMRPSMGIV